MKPQAILLLLVCVALGAATWFAFRGDDAPPPGTAPSANGAQIGQNTGSTVEPASAGQVGDVASDNVETGGVERTAVTDPTKAGVAGRPMLRARLVDSDGNPRVGVEVSVDFWSTDFADIDVENAGPGQSREKVKADAEGRIAVHVPAGRSGTFSLTDDELVFAERVRFQGKQTDQELGNLLVVRAASIAGIVQDANGKPVEGVAVEAQLGALGFDVASRATSAEDGTFSVGKLRPGKWNLRTASSQYLPTSEEVELEMEQRITDVVITVEPGRMISGRVIDDRGRGVPGMKVASRRKESMRGIEIERFSGDEAAVTDENGDFTLAGLAGDSATVRAYGPGHTSVTKPGIATGTRNLELRVQPLASIRGVLLTTAGDPIAGSKISWSEQQGGSMARAIVEDFVDIDVPMGRTEATTAEDGSFVLNDVAPGTVIVRARGKAHVATEQGGVRVTPAQQVTGIRLRADVGAVARVEVVDADGNAIEGAKVTVGRAPKPKIPGMEFEVRTAGNIGSDMMVAGLGSLGTAKTDESGIATIMGLPTCAAVVNATHADYAPSSQSQLALPASGTVDSRITMADPGFVDVMVTRFDGSAAADQDVVLQVPGASNGQFVDKGKTDAEGKIRFGPLGAGNYVAALSHGLKERNMGGMTMIVGAEEEVIASSTKNVTVFVGKTAEVQLQYPLMTRLTGRVMGVDGPVANCLVELNDGTEGTGLEGFGGRQEKTDKHGAFTFENVESGDYILYYGKASQIVRAEEPLAVPANTPELHRELTLRTGTVKVAVVAADDAEPVERAEVELVRPGNTNAGDDDQPRPQRVMMVSFTMDGDGGEETSTMTLGQKSVKTDEDGIAVFEDVPVGDYDLKVTHRRYAPGAVDEVQVVEGQVTDCGTIELAGAGQIRGQLLGSDGKRVRMGMVEHRKVGTEEWGGPEMAMQGSFRLTGLAPGRYEVRGRKLGTQAGESSEPVEVEVKAGKTKVQDITVPD